MRHPGGHPYLVVFDFDAMALRGKPNSKKVKETKLEETRNISLYAVDPGWVPGKALYIVAAVGKHLLIYKWQSATKTFSRFRVRLPLLGPRTNHAAGAERGGGA